MLESAAQIVALLGGLAALIKFVGPWIKRKSENWWNKTKDQTGFTLGYKIKSRRSEIHSPRYTIGYLFISYKTSYRMRFIGRKFEFLHSFYKKIGELPKFEGTASTGSINNLIRFMKERRDTGDSRGPYIYRETNVLAFYPIKTFDQMPDWTNLPCVELQTRTYFKRYESKKQNRYDIQNGSEWLKSEELEVEEWLGITPVNVEHNQDPLIPESKKIIKLLKKGFKKQFETYKIGDVVCIRRKWLE